LTWCKFNTHPGWEFGGLSKILSFLSHGSFTFLKDCVLSPEKIQKAMKKMRIAIENPCHEDWQGMTPEAQGRFCAACEKTVIDFTRMSDAEILHYFSQPRTEKVCGRFRSEQLSNGEEKAIEPIKNSESSLHVSNFQSQPTKQLLHFAYLLVLVLGVGLSACGESAVTGQVQGKAITVDSSDQTSSEKSNPENVKPKREVVELMGDTVASIEVEEKPQNTRHQSPQPSPNTTPLMGKPVVHTPRQPEKCDPSQYMTGPYEHTLKPANAVDTGRVVKPKADPRPQPPKFIKGKVKLPKNPIPEVQKPVEERQDIRIMGECVVPYEYEKPKG
jgi:hypothetical protein